MNTIIAIIAIIAIIVTSYIHNPLILSNLHRTHSSTMDLDSSVSAAQSAVTISEKNSPLLLARSNVHEHCRTIQSDEPSHDSQGRLIYYCKYCPWAKITTTNFRQHLRTKHQVDSPVSNDQPVIDVNEKLQQLYKQLKKINGTLEFDEAILH